MKCGDGGLEIVTYTGDRIKDKEHLETTCGVLETFTIIGDHCRE